MKKIYCCAILGHSPMRFAWGFDEEDMGCKDLKLELLQQIMALRQQGVTQFCVACDYGVGLYAAEAVNLLRENDTELQLYCFQPYEEQATKWAPYLRERYFTMLKKCTYIIPVGKRKAPEVQLHAYQYMINQSDIVLAVYDSDSARDDDVDNAILYSLDKQKTLITIHPDTFEIKYR